MATDAKAEVGAGVAAPAAGEEAPLGPSSKRLGILTGAHAVTHMANAVLPLVYPLLMTSMGFGYVSLGFMLGATRLVGGLLQGVWGSVARRIPSKWLLFGEQVGVGLSIWVTGRSFNYPELSGAVMLTQVTASPHHPLASDMLSRWYGKARGSALATHFAGANIAQLVSPLIFTFLVVRWGWRPAVDVFILPCLVLAALVAFGLPAEATRPAAQARHGAAHGAGSGADRRPGGGLSGVIALMRDPLPRRLILTASVTAGGKGLGILQTIIPLLLIRGMHLSTTTSGLIFTAFTATSVVGPFFAGRLSDRYPRPRFLSAMLAFSACASVAMAFASRMPLTLVVVLLAAFGTVVYSCSPVEQAIMGDITAEALSADAYSLFYGLTFGASAIWPVLLTWVLARWGFPACFVTIAATYVVGFIVYGTQDWTPSHHGPAASAGR